MPDDNRFANIGVDDADADTDGDAAPDDGRDDPSDASSAEDVAEPTADDEAPGEEASESTGDADTTATDDAVAPTVDPADSGPAFEFDAVRQKAVYPRPDSWDAREAALDFEVKRKLRDHGVKDVTGRELDDAIARTIPDVTDLIVENVLEARRRKFEDD
ncbi:hypothetical protein [Halarchaeum nitratireducens]|uniref:Uncharacterized protein n=1 Tax=Halarchaeum nitratireducens TaxID=489913 RepID=A0A830GCA3_9EURY|nr:MULTISPECIES: hypothetical protein [Halarchaeum]MBP2252460.1 hypothetical protein [Halarchaeum solikamskense]GGN21052.1 hypothetical protein GCM10009021_22880 [Halarchaeum nitratireducens]